VSAPNNLRRKHVPQRTCVGCRLTLPKRSLIRVVRCPDGIYIDPTGKAAGRGAYLHKARSCWERGLKGALANALKTELKDDDRDRLTNYMESLPTESPETEQLVDIPPDNSSVDASQTEAGNVI
jgi:predicted RNA-binding protein YlxR (DUF448 family)